VAGPLKLGAGVVAKARQGLAQGLHPRP
jgi:hypothetical protein